MPLSEENIRVAPELSRRQPPPPLTLVVFGASGDLTRRKLIPGVFALFRQGLLPEKIRVVGYSRSDLSDDHFREALEQGAQIDGHREQWNRFARRLHYLQGQYDQADDFQRLAQRLDELAREDDRPNNCLFYLSTPPDAFIPIIENLAQAGLNRQGGTEDPWSRIVIEKPFGTDLETARQLNAALARTFAESQVFRIDHYLGKETVQNILVLRWANGIFEPLWNQRYIDHVQITVAESLGVGQRGGYYETSGAIRDMVQNHMMQLISLVAMEPPASLSSDAIRDEKVKVLRALRPIPADCAANGVIRAQYTPGAVDGEQVAGYLEEEGVNPSSGTETYAAFKAYIDNWRWSEVPFYLRTGKRLPQKVSEVSVHFKGVPQVLFNTGPTGPLQPNVLILRIQPDEGISMSFQVKVPGSGMRIDTLTMDFNYRESFHAEPPEAYQRLLLDAARGEPTLFTRSDEVEEAWQFVEPILEGCSWQSARQIAKYPAGTWGPPEADRMVAEDGNRWRLH